MEKSLLILAAGLSARYGKLKQSEKIGPNKETIYDYSIYDALQNGIKNIYFVVNENIKSDFIKETYAKYKDICSVDFIVQNSNDIPNKYGNIFKRNKPWGTAHALYSARKKMVTPFVMINADDFYGRSSFEAASFFMEKKLMNDNFLLIGFKAFNTLHTAKPVSRAVCKINNPNEVVTIEERKMGLDKKGVFITERDNEKKYIPGNTVVSMNMYAFSPFVFLLLEKYLETFLSECSNPDEDEFQLPVVLNSLLSTKKCKGNAIVINDDSFGLTFPEDKKIVIDKLHQLILKNIYPEKLFDSYV